MKYFLVFVLGFILGPIVVIEGCGKYMEYRIHQMDMADMEKRKISLDKQIQHVTP